MGATGSGKTSFINMASQSSLRVGSSLESCTLDIQLANPFTLDGCNITLIDTPGFDDTTRSDSDILQLIASFLSLSYEQGHALSGIIYVHRISDVKMGGMSRRNFSLFRKLCGDNAMKNVAIVTTRWDCVQPDVGKSRELELTNNDAFFKPVLDLGAKMMRHQPQTPDGTQAILRRLIKNQPVALQIQEELVDRQLHLSQTMAGAELGKEQLEQVERHRKIPRRRRNSKWSAKHWRIQFDE
ncbi:hypothetical protein BD410DRAFT_823264 [Rickenella mellea]|uniref:AIG1-type G domain-containing protein n=1 Tax=Rickenella mellea TaxID=50990 RepID=A0A4Y7PDE9_9AGAM|nr:hypothetical protein BD410DRAFT_823264 [Rickenella mellea]